MPRRRPAPGGASAPIPRSPASRHRRRARPPYPAARRTPSPQPRPGGAAPAAPRERYAAHLVRLPPIGYPPCFTSLAAAAHRWCYRAAGWQPQACSDLFALLLPDLPLPPRGKGSSSAWATPPNGPPARRAPFPLYHGRTGSTRLMFRDWLIIKDAVGNETDAARPRIAGHTLTGSSPPHEHLRLRSRPGRQGTVLPGPFLHARGCCFRPRCSSDRLCRW